MQEQFKKLDVKVKYKFLQLIDIINIYLSIGSANLRRSHSQRENLETNQPSFNDTFRLRQNVSRPAIPQFDRLSRPIKPLRKVPKIQPVLARTPSRPSIPPPPPPTIKEDDDGSSGSSSPPPLPKSLPPPLPSSSPPPLEDTGIDPHSAVCISSRIVPVNTLPSVDFGGSVFDLCEEKKTATVKNRLKVVSVPNLLTFQGNQNDSFNGYHSSPKAPKRTISAEERDPNQRSSFLFSMMEEHDNEERFSDHIYEELPSLPSSPSGGSNANTPSPERSMFDGASKYEILEYLQDARNRVNISPEDTDNMIGDFNVSK